MKPRITFRWSDDGRPAFEIERRLAAEMIRSNRAAARTTDLVAVTHDRDTRRTLLSTGAVVGIIERKP